MVRREVGVKGQAREPPVQAQVASHLQLRERLVQELTLGGDDADVAGELFGIEQAAVRREHHVGDAFRWGDDLRIENDGFERVQVTLVINIAPGGDLEVMSVTTVPAVDILLGDANREEE